jgi:hypothetical protein
MPIISAISLTDLDRCRFRKLNPFDGSAANQNMIAE